MLGLHPVYVDKNYLQELDFVEKNINANNFVAVGEIGLDKYWSTEFYEQQIEAFESQIDLAIKNKLPVIIHCRDAYEDTIDILGTEQVMYSFSIESRDITKNDLEISYQFLPRFDCNEFPFGKAS